MSILCCKFFHSISKFSTILAMCSFCSFDYAFSSEQEHDPLSKTSKGANSISKNKLEHELALVTRDTPSGKLQLIVEAIEQITLDDSVLQVALDEPIDVLLTKGFPHAAMCLLDHEILKATGLDKVEKTKRWAEIALWSHDDADVKKKYPNALEIAQISIENVIKNEDNKNLKKECQKIEIDIKKAIKSHKKNK